MNRLACIPLALLVFAPAAFADKIVLKDGRAFEGRLVKEGVDEISIEVAILGNRVVMTVSRKEIVSHEKSLSPIEQYEEKARVVRKNDATSLLALSAWCREHKLFDQSRRHLLEAAKAKPDHPGVAKEMTEMGYVLVDGAWVDEVEHKRKRGLARWGDAWLPIDEVNRRRSEEDKKRKLSAADSKLGSLQKEYDRLRDDVRRKIAEVRALVAEYVGLAETLSAEKAKLAAAESDLASLQLIAAMNPNDRARMQAEIGAAQIRLVRTRNACRTATDKMAALERKGEACIKALNEMMGKKERIERENADTLARIDALQETPKKSSPSGAQAGGDPLTPEQIFERVAPAVVRIEVKGPRGIAMGSGFFVDADGMIVTNAHVVKDALSIVVVRFGAKYPVVGIPRIDSALDLACLKVEAKGVSCLRLSDRKPRVGEKVYSIGTPLGIFTNTLADGLVSGIRKEDLNDYLIQITAPISRGCSGGPLLDETGTVLGVTTATVVGGQNLNFAIPAYAVRRMLGR